MSKVTLAAVARRADVSEATVSRVLNNKPGVAEATRVAVLTAVDVLGYDRPSNLRAKPGQLIGLITPELTNPIFPAFAQCIETLLARRGFTAVLCTQTAGGLQEDDYVEMLTDRGVAGIVFLSGMHANRNTSPERYVRLRASGLPIVLINGFMAGIEAPFISHDDAASIRVGLAHLASLGHRRIGLAAGQERYVPTSRKIAAFLAGVADLGLDGVVSTSQYTLEGGSQAARRLLAEGVTGILCGSDLMALGVIRHAQAEGLSVPRDLSVVGFDDSMFMEFTWPPLTTVRQRVIEMAEAAVHLLLDEISGTPAPREEYLFAPELVVRGSTGPAPSG